LSKKLHQREEKCKKISVLYINYLDAPSLYINSENRKPPVGVVIPYNLAPCYLPAVAVFSPLLSLTSVFGMGTGISSVLWAPIALFEYSMSVD
jgi:hypothetical protein